MLMQTFLSATELGIPKEHRQALIATLALMETGKLTHIETSTDVKMIKDFVTNVKWTGHFNMEHWRVRDGCNTVCCLGGTAELISGVDFEHLQLTEALNDLFFPLWLNWPDITVEEATHALRAYLITGEADWKLTTDRQHREDYHNGKVS